MTTDDGAPDHEDLLQFLYVMPVGVLQCDEAGLVTLVNPAAARLLAPALAGTDLHQLHPLLARLCPELLAVLTADEPQLGPVGGSRRFLATTSAEHDLHVELLAVRVQIGMVMVVVLDRALELQLIGHERAQLTELDSAIVQDLVAAETALGLGDLDTVRHLVWRSADAGRALLGRQLELLSREPIRALELVLGPAGRLAPTPSAPSPRRTVLVVDDSDELRAMLELLLSDDSSGWVVVGSATNGLEAIDKAAELAPDLVLLDVSMPVMDGLTALPRIRRAAPDAAVIMVSAFPSAHLRQGAIEAGAAGFIDKTRLTDTLVPAIERILQDEARSA